MVKDWMQEKTTRKLNPWIVLFVIFTLAYFAVKTQGPMELAHGAEKKGFCLDPQSLNVAIDSGSDAALKASLRF